MTYPQMAQALGLAYCGGILPTGHYCHAGEHALNGSVADDTIHFTDRQVTKSNTLAFLKLAALAMDPEINDDVPWRRVYRIDKGVLNLCRFLGIGLPAHLWRGDKRFVLSSIGGLTNEVPMRKQAFDWARR